MPGIIHKMLQGICQMIPDDEPKRYLIGIVMSTA